MGILSGTGRGLPYTVGVVGESDMSKLSGLLFVAVQVLTASLVAASPDTRLSGLHKVEGTQRFECPGEGFFAMPGECTADYFLCYQNVAYTQKCPGGNLFDPETLVCTSPDTVSCREETTVAPTTSGPFVCPGDGNFAIPGQCVGDYYICIGGTAYLVICPGGQIFDPNYGFCVPPESATCFSPGETTLPSSTDAPTTAPTTTPPTTPPTTPETTTPTIPSTTMEVTTMGPTPTEPFLCTSDGSFALPGQCTGDYIICFAGVPYPLSCPEPYIFDPISLVCVPPESASCFDTTTAAPTTAAPTTAAPTTTAPPTDPTDPSTTQSTTAGPFVCSGEGSFPIPGECSANYIICIDGVPYPSTCPGNSIFDPAVNLCVLPETASCLSTTGPQTTVMTTPTTPSTTTTQRPSGPCQSPDGVFPLSPDACANEYYICVNGIAYLTFCNFGGIFDPLYLTCVPAGTASCQQTTRPIVTTPAPGETTTIGGPFVCPAPDGLFDNPADCDTYYSCSNSIPILQQCPPGTAFNPTINTCDFPSNVPGCSKRKTLLDLMEV